MEAPENTIANNRNIRARGSKATPTHYRWKATTVNAYALAILGLVLLLGTVGVAKGLNIWGTSGKVTAGGEKVSATGTNVAEIKGFMTIKEVLDAYQVPQEEFYAKFGVPADMPVTTQLKEIEKVAPGFSTTALRDWLAQRTK